MKKIICYIDSMQIGGAQRVMAILTEHFVNVGYKTILVNDITPEVNVPEYHICEGVERVFLDKVKHNNVIKKNYTRIRTLRSLIKMEKPDIVLSFLGPPNFRMLISAAGIKTRKIVSVRNDPYREYGSGIMRSLARTIFKLADGCIFQTKEAAQYFSSTTRVKSTVIQNPVRDVFFSTDWKSDGKTIVMVGRLNAQKNYSMAIKAFARIARTHPQIVMRIIGEGEQRREIQKEIDNLGLQDRITLAGQVKNVEKELASAALFLMTSDYEGLPNSLMEAMAIGLPVIATDCPCGGAKSLIDNNENGKLIPCGNVEIAAQTMEELIEDSCITNRLSENAKRSASDFRTDRILKQWDNFLAL